MFLTSFVIANWVDQLLMHSFFAVTWQLYGSTHIRAFLTPPVCARVSVCLSCARHTAVSLALQSIKWKQRQGRQQ